MKEGTLTICLPTLHSWVNPCDAPERGARHVPNVPLSNQDAGMVDALCQPELVHTSL